MNIDEKKEPEEEDQSLSVSVPYVQGFSEKFQTIMKNEGIKVVFMKGRTLENELCNLKTPKGRMEPIWIQRSIGGEGKSKNPCI